MTHSAEDAAFIQRATRILDAATELLVKFGYKRVTVEDIAGRAGVGKGTVYLHWKTKRDVFAVAMLRDAVHLVRALLDGIRADPGEVRLHRVRRASYLEIMSRPLSKALYTEDTEVLGALAQSDAPGFREMQEFGREVDLRYNAALRDHGLLRTDLDQSSQRYAINAASRGFFLLDRQPFTDDQLDRHAKADALALTLRNAFEPTEEPDPEHVAEAAALVIELYSELLTKLEALLPGHRAPGRTTRGG